MRISSFVPHYDYCEDKGIRRAHYAVRVNGVRLCVDVSSIKIHSSLELFQFLSRTDNRTKLNGGICHCLSNTVQSSRNVSRDGQHNDSTERVNSTVLSLIASTPMC